MGERGSRKEHRTASRVRSQKSVARIQQFVGGLVGLVDLVKFVGNALRLNSIVSIGCRSGLCCEIGEKLLKLAVKGEKVFGLVFFRLSDNQEVGKVTFFPVLANCLADNG